jgi:MoaA/NifB/PqqE/SkfB family radical SAM enzyme
VNETWNILYRGSLSSCNYACTYCPFAKTANTREELLADERQLERFVGWVGAQQNSPRRRLGILFTPWGEALIHQYYRRAMMRLAAMPYVYRVAIQTNLSAPLGEFVGVDEPALAFWATFHPTQTSLTGFLSRCRELDEAGIRYSVGVVGMREHFGAIESLRSQLRPEVYLWINALKRVPNYYSHEELQRLQAVDPYFHWNLQTYVSSGRSCRAGETTFTVDGAGDVRRCHFIDEVLGNIYDPTFPECLKPRPCSAMTCGCHIGYVHRPDLRLDGLYGDGLLERIPARWPEHAAGFARAAREAREVT